MSEETEGKMKKRFDTLAKAIGFCFLYLLGLAFLGIGITNMFVDDLIPGGAPWVWLIGCVLAFSTCFTVARRLLNSQ
jgi:hypothetical protein